MAGALGRKQWSPAKTVLHEEARTLTLASAARSFSDFTAAAIAAATDDSSHAPHAQPRDALDQVSYFETLMQLRCRRPAQRRASRRD